MVSYHIAKHKRLQPRVKSVKLQNSMPAGRVTGSRNHSLGAQVLINGKINCNYSVGLQYVEHLSPQNNSYNLLGYVAF